MVLVTGATGFIGGRMIRTLAEAGRPVKILLKPSRRSPRVPAGLSVEAALAAMEDRRGIRAAMVGVRHVIHLASAERHPPRSRVLREDVEGARNIVDAAADAGVDRVIFLSHLGAQRASAYPLLRAKAIAEDEIRVFGPGATVIRSGTVFGPGDHFTTSLAKVMGAMPGVVPIPGEGRSLLQPLWVEDLVHVLLMTLDDPQTAGKTYEIGGPEFISVRDSLRVILQACQMSRVLFPTPPSYLRGIVWGLERLLPRPPLTLHSLDYAASNRTAALNSLTRMVGLQPSRMEPKLDYLRRKNWGWELIAEQFARDGSGPA